MGGVRWRFPGSGLALCGSAATTGGHRTCIVCAEGGCSTLLERARPGGGLLTDRLRAALGDVAHAGCGALETATSGCGTRLPGSTKAATGKER